MSLLIDGYNLLHASDVFAPADAPPTLERSRQALLDFLVVALPAKEIRRAMIVFDAVTAPPGLPRQMNHQGLAVQFAPRGETADALLEELIAAEADPRNLLVVSSDHRVQRAARQRGAQYIDSEVWHRDLAASRPRSPESAGEKPILPIGNPFPPGYAADLLDD